MAMRLRQSERVSKRKHGNARGGVKMQPLVEDIQPLVEGFLEDYNGIPYRQFFGHEYAYERLGMEDIWNGFYLLNSFLFAAS